MNRSVRNTLLMVALLCMAAAVVWVFFFKSDGKHQGRKQDTRAARGGNNSPDRYRPQPVQLNPGSRPDRKPGILRELFGRIRSEKGAPVGGAAVRVVLLDRSVRFALSDGDGQYTVRKVPRKARLFEVSARGYQTRLFRTPTFPHAARVRWDVTLFAASGVHGVVISGDKPAAGARVFITPETNREQVLQHGVADLGGRFSLVFSPGKKGRFYVRAFHAQYGRGEVAVDGPGEVTIRLPGGGYVEGTVSDDQGRAVRQFTLSASGLLRGAGGPPAQTFEDLGGRFRLGPLAAGTHKLWAAARGYQPAESAPIKVQSGSTVSGIRLTLRGSGVVKGKVTDAKTGSPVQGALVTAAEWRASVLAEAVGSYTGADGRYILRSVPGVRTSLSVKAKGYLSLLAGGVESGPGEEVERNFALTRADPGKKAKGELTGIGAVLRKKGPGVEILKLLDGGPAAEVLTVGDFVVMVDDLDVADIGIGEVAQAIRGEPDTEVVLWVRRGGRGEPVRVVINRTRVKLPGK